MQIREWQGNIGWLSALRGSPLIGRIAGIRAITDGTDDFDKWSKTDQDNWTRILKNIGTGIDLHFLPQVNSWLVTPQSGWSPFPQRLVPLSESNILYNALIAEKDHDRVELRVYVRNPIM